MSPFQFRAALLSDYPTIVTLNEESEHFLSPLNLDKLARLANEAAVFQVALSGDTVAGFLLAFLHEANYESPNFLWFKARYTDFFYIDRIVVAEPFRSRHLASDLYGRLESQAISRGISRLACEVDIEPPNPVSIWFHQKHNFIEVGQQSIRSAEKGNHQKIVSLQMKRLVTPVP